MRAFFILFKQDFLFILPIFADYSAVFFNCMKYKVFLVGIEIAYLV